MFSSCAISLDLHSLHTRRSSDLYYSNDGGQTWTKSDAPSQNWTGIASSADGTRMVAVFMTGNVYTSTNGGTNWIVQSGSPSASDRKSTRLNSSHANISYAVFCLK